MALMHNHFLQRETVAFAFVASSLTGTRDLIDGVLPIFTPVLSQMAKRSAIFDADDFAKNVTNSLHIPMKPLVASALKPKLVRAGFLKQRRGRSDIYTIESQAFQSHGGHVNVDMLQEKFNKLLDDFCLFMREQSAEGTIPSDDDIKEGFRKRILTLEFLNVIEPDASNRSQPEIFEMEQFLDAKHEEKSAWEQEVYLDLKTAEFVESIKNNSEKTKILEMLVKGTLIAEVVFSLVPRSDSAQLLRDVSVVVDAPLLLNRLDLSAVSEDVGYATDLFDMMRYSQVRICAFTHSLSEMERILETAIKDQGDTSFREREGGGWNARPLLGERLARDNKTHMRAIRASKNIRGAVEELGVTIINSNECRSNDYLCHCDTDMESVLQHALSGWNRGYKATEADAASVATTMRLREGNNPMSIVEAQWLFLTSSHLMAKNANGLLHGKGLISSLGIPPVMTDRELAASLWFSAGSSNDTMLSKYARDKIVALCSATLEPHGGITSKIRAILAEMGMEDQLENFKVFMGSDRARHFIMLESRGNPSNITCETVMGYLDMMRRKMTDEDTKEATAQTAAQKDAERQASEKLLKERIAISEQKAVENASERDTWRDSAKSEKERAEDLSAQIKASERERQTIADARDDLRQKMLENEEHRWEAFRNSIDKILNECHAEVALKIGVGFGVFSGMIPLLIAPEMGGLLGMAVGLTVGGAAWKTAASTKWGKRILYRRLVAKKAHIRIHDMASALGISRDDHQIIDDDKDGIKIVRKNSPLQ